MAALFDLFSFLFLYFPDVVHRSERDVVTKIRIRRRTISAVGQMHEKIASITFTTHLDMFGVGTFFYGLDVRRVDAGHGGFVCFCNRPFF